MGGPTFFKNLNQCAMKTLKLDRERKKQIVLTIIRNYCSRLKRLSSGSCNYRWCSGRAYLAFTWTEHEPEYFDPGTYAIPDVFYWDEYYRISPGLYTMYYDGAYYDRGNLIEYAWELDYEIYITPGERGTPHYIGRDGVDNYFTLECNPYGPWMYQDFKSSEITPGLKVKEVSEEKIVIEKEMSNYTLKVTYKKVEKRKR